MNQRATSVEDVLRSLQERAKELNTLYRVEEILRAADRPVPDLLRALVEALPAGWQFPAHCQARLRLRAWDVQTPGYEETAWVQRAPVRVQGEVAGTLSVAYTQPFPEADEGPFLKEERKLIDTVAERLGQTLLHRDLQPIFGDAGGRPAPRQDWRVILELLRRTDLSLFARLTRKLLNYLSVNGLAEAQALLHQAAQPPAGEAASDQNRPLPSGPATDADALGARTFEIAAEHLSESELLSCVQVWIKEDRVNFLMQTLESSYASLVAIRTAIERYQHTGVDARELSVATQNGLKSALIRRLLTDQLDFIDVCRRHVEVPDFVELMKHTVLLPQSHGKLGGKSSGLFLAGRVLARSADSAEALSSIKVPKTWYLPSDGIVQFVAHNNLDDVYNWRYRDIRQIRQEYPHLLRVFKSSGFPPQIVNGLQAALDDLGDRPLIVRSSSLLEDRVGSAFSGKYKSLFLANQGTKAERLAALLDAIAEVYASVFGPDPIQYRAERGLLEHHEEMAIMIQEVVGTRVGPYFLPAFSGVGLSNNELRWSPRIRREDGLLRLVPGLGTRAVDRLADDYTVLAAPGQPGLRVNVTPEEACRYSPRRVDLINLETGAFETVERRTLLERAGGRIPWLPLVASAYDGDMLRPVDGLHHDFARDDVVFTFDGLLRDTPFLGRMRALLERLREALGVPVDVEFAHDGTDFYLLQCRSQSYGRQDAPAAIPRDVPAERVLFSANRYVSNGSLPDATHVVYVDGDAYGRLSDPARLRAVGSAIGHLNKVLPRGQFVLMGPGRWGSRGDIRLGVPVTYADINHTSLLIEVARRRGQYVPELSFGTHFFQDLVESSIRYLPLYPDDPGVVFNEAFFAGALNLLPRLLPEFASLADVVRVIDVPRESGGRVLRVLMNADLGEALGLLAPPGGAPEAAAPPPPAASARPGDDHWGWRLGMARTLAAHLDARRFGVRALYLLGSTRNATAAAGADIDLLVHFAGTAEQRRELQAWLEGWSLSLAEADYLRTGWRSAGLLDVRYVSDDEVAARTGFAAKIGAVTDPARPLPLA